MPTKREVAINEVIAVHPPEPMADVTSVGTINLYNFEINIFNSKIDIYLVKITIICMSLFLYSVFINI